jgi:hypothetical protein
MMNSQLPQPEEGASAEERVEFYKSHFLDFVASTELAPESLVRAWHIWALYQESKQKRSGMLRPEAINLHINMLLPRLDAMEYIDPTTASLAILPLILFTVNRNGELPEKSILRDLPEQQLESARSFCVKMIEVGEDPRLLAEM